MKFTKFYFYALAIMTAICSGYSLAIYGEWAIPQIIIAAFLFILSYRILAEEL